MVTINDTESDGGEIRGSVFSAVGTNQSFQAWTVTFQGFLAGSTNIEVEVIAAGDEQGTSLLEKTTSRQHTLTIND